MNRFDPIKQHRLSGIATLFILCNFCSCTNITKEETAVWGAMGGAILGAVIGHQSGEGDSGARLGAAIGGLAGYGGGYAAEKARITREQEEVAAAMAYEKEMAELAEMDKREAEKRKKQLEQQLAEVITERDLQKIQGELAKTEAILNAKKQERDNALNRSRELADIQARLAKAEEELEALEREAMMKEQQL